MGQFDHSTYAIDNIFSDQIYQGSIFFCLRGRNFKNIAPS